MPLRRSNLSLRCVLVRSALALSVLAPLAGPRAGAQELLYVTEGNRLRRIDVDTIDRPPLAGDVLVRNASEGEDGPAGAEGRDVNGLVCRFPDGSGRFLLGEDTGQRNGVPPGWGIFSADGVQVGKLAATGFVPQPEPFGCAFDAEGRLFTTEIGDPFTTNGQLVQWFPPYEGFPGAPGSYPNGEFSTNHCKLSVSIGAASGVAVAPDGSLLVASPREGSVARFSGAFPTGPDAAGGCGRDDGGTPAAPLVDAGRIQREIFIQHPSVPTPSGITRGPNGNWFVSSVLFGTIAEFDPSGAWVRTVMEPPEGVPPIELPASVGHPQSVAFDSGGTLYYSDLDLRGSLLFPDTGPNGSVRRIRFDASGAPLPPERIRDGLSFPDGVAVLGGDLEPTEWRSYGGGPRRLFFNPEESTLTPENVARLTTRWEFFTGAIVTATPSVATVDVPGEGRTQVVYFQSWDDHVYAVRLRDGSELWSFRTDTQPGANFPNAASVDVSAVDGRDTVLIGAGETFYALDAVIGEEIWRFAAGTGCRDEQGQPPGSCSQETERNQIESSAIVADGKVFFGMDVNDNVSGTGGFFALDVRTGHLAWFFDLQSGQTCRPDPGDAVTRFDAYHTEEELGLPAGFSATRAGCDFPRRRTGCGNVWSSPAHDAGRGWLFVASSNCDTDADPATPQPTISDPPTMPPFDEAIFALDTDGNPIWRWRPREVDPFDLAFGAVPSLFSIEIDGRLVDVVGVGNKDGTYYVLDRDGVNEASGLRWDDPDPSALPYWTRNLVPGGSAGGIIGSSAVDEAARRLYVGTAPGFDPTQPQRPTVHALDLDTGAVLWTHDLAEGFDSFGTFSPTTGVPGLAFTGSVPFNRLRAFDAGSGELVYSDFVGSVLSLTAAIASGPTVVDGTVLVGVGIGARFGDPNDPGEQTSRVASPLVALCVPGTRGCGECDDGIDNDEDGFTDHGGDPGCEDAADPSERSDSIACDNGADDDGDGLADERDPGCAVPHAPREDPECDDGLDNDGDGLFDFDDPVCRSDWPYRESPACGLGFEGAPVLALLLGLARRRRRAAG